MWVIVIKLDLAFNNVKPKPASTIVVAVLVAVAVAVDFSTI